MYACAAFFSSFFSSSSCTARAGAGHNHLMVVEWHATRGPRTPAALLRPLSGGAVAVQLLALLGSQIEVGWPPLLVKVMEQLRRVVSSIKEPLPAKTRAIVISRAQKILEGICKKAECIPIKERAPLSAAVAEVQAWVQQQLDQRLDLKVDDSEQAVMEGLASLVAAADLAR